MQSYRYLLIGAAIAYAASLAGAYLNLAHFQGEYFPKGNFIAFCVAIVSAAICRLIGRTPFIATSALIALSMAFGMISGIVAHSEINSAPSLATYQPSVYWHSVMIGLVFSSFGALIGSLGLLIQRRATTGRPT